MVTLLARGEVLLASEHVRLLGGVAAVERLFGPYVDVLVVTDSR